tara:strand:+ start:168 stop:344 length:177 start_codon:yes stop_codon:yes gene_type:complete
MAVSSGKSPKAFRFSIKHESDKQVDQNWKYSTMTSFARKKEYPTALTPNWNHGPSLTV